LKGHSAAIKLNLDGKKHTIGVFGILHPSVLQKFELP
jgi:phenylalanyl-tRNA synthetase beta chain